MNETKRKIILASSSKYRAELLRKTGIEFTAISPDCDERVGDGLSVEEAVIEIAMKKMSSIEKLVSGSIIIAGDQMMEVGGRAVGKVQNPEKALELLIALSGNSHRLLTSLIVKDQKTNKVLSHLDVHRFKMRNYSVEEAKRYIEIEKPFDCTGALKIESRGILLIESVEGHDYTAIIGLPVIKLVSFLKQLGYNPLTS